MGLRPGIISSSFILYEKITDSPDCFGFRKVTCESPRNESGFRPKLGSARVFRAIMGFCSISSSALNRTFQRRARDKFQFRPNSFLEKKKKTEKGDEFFFFYPTHLYSRRGGKTREESAREGAAELSHPWTSVPLCLLFLSARGAHFGLCLEFNKAFSFLMGIKWPLLLLKEGGKNLKEEEN